MVVVSGKIDEPAQITGAPRLALPAPRPIETVNLPDNTPTTILTPTPDDWADPSPPPKPVPLPSPQRVSPNYRRPAVGLTLLVLVALIGAFFGWVSADPFWLAVGRGTEGTVTVDACESSLTADRCTGIFTASDGSFTTDRVRISSVPDGERRVDTELPARILNESSDWAYAGSTSGLQLRWILGAALVLLCGLAVGSVTGVRKLRSEPLRRRLLLRLIGLVGPLAIFATMLGVAAF